MRKSERAEIIRKELKKLYPSPPIPLDHTNAYTLLVAVVLSAQSTDKKVNELTKSLFRVADNPEKMIGLGINGIYCLLYTSPSPRDPKTSRMPSSA